MQSTHTTLETLFHSKTLLRTSALISSFPSGNQAKRKVKNVEEATKWKIMHFKSAGVIGSDTRHNIWTQHVSHLEKCNIWCSLDINTKVCAVRSPWHQNWNSWRQLTPRLYITLCLNIFQKYTWVVTSLKIFFCCFFAKLLLVSSTYFSVILL